jgi:hypothetical protein
MRSAKTSRIGLGRSYVLAMAAGLMALGASQRAGADVITFDSQTGGGAAFVSDTEGGFTVTPTSGNWFQSDFGNPGPSIFDGPVDSPSDSALDISSANPFTFSSLDYASNNGTSTFVIKGFLAGNPVFTESGALVADVNPFPFTTLNATPADSLLSIDDLTVEVDPTGGPTSINIDNIVVSPEAASVPLPSTFLSGGSILAMMAMGLMIKSRRGVKVA